MGKIFKNKREPKISDEDFEKLKDVVDFMTDRLCEKKVPIALYHKNTEKLGKILHNTKIIDLGDEKIKQLVNAEEQFMKIVSDIIEQ